MKKQIIAIIVLLIAAATTIGVFLGVKNKEEKKTQQQLEELNDLELFSFDPETITKAEFSFDNQNYTVNLVDDEWQLENPEFDLSTTYINDVCSCMSYLSAEESYGTADDEKKAMYGLNNPSTIVLTGADQTYKVYVGDQSPTANYYYVMIDGRDTIYAIDILYGSVLKTNKMFLKSDELLPYDDGEIAEITVKRNGTTAYTLKYDTESRQWSLPEEYSRFTFDQTAVSAVTTVLTRLTAVEMLEENFTDLKKYGFDKPFAEAIIKGTDGTEVKYIFGNAADNTGTYYHALSEDNQVMMFYTGELVFLTYSPIDFIQTSISNTNLQSITGFELTYNDKKEVFTVNTDENKATCDGKALDLNNTELWYALNNYFNAFSYIHIMEIDIETEPEITDPILTAVYFLEDGSELTYQITDAGNEQCYTFINGEYTGALISMKDITGKNSLNTFAQKFKELAGIS